jgi:hypothetical protein
MTGLKRFVERTTHRAKRVFAKHGEHLADLSRDHREREGLLLPRPRLYLGWERGDTSR